MSKEDIQHPFGDDELKKFEQQLRLVKPVPPQSKWQGSSGLPEPQANVRLSTANQASLSNAHWHRLASHAAAVLIGIGIGAIFMLMLQVSNATSNTTVSGFGPAEQKENGGDASRASSSDLQFASERELEKQRFRKWATFSNRTSDSSPLTPFTRVSDSQSWQSSSHARRPVSLQKHSSPTEQDSFDKSKSAHELMCELLKEHA